MTARVVLLLLYKLCGVSASLCSYEFCNDEIAALAVAARQDVVSKAPCLYWCS